MRLTRHLHYGNWSNTSHTVGPCLKCTWQGCKTSEIEKPIYEPSDQNVNRKETKWNLRPPNHLEREQERFRRIWKTHTKTLWRDTKQSKEKIHEATKAIRSEINSQVKKEMTKIMKELHSITTEYIYEKSKEKKKMREISKE